MKKTKRDKIIYWVSTLWLALGMASTAMVQLSGGEAGPGAGNSMARLGYPAYLLAFLAVCKLGGVAALLIPGRPLLKEWAYAGFIFIMSGAIYSHIAAGDAAGESFPAFLLLILTGISWYFRPRERKISMLKPKSN